MFVSGNAFVFVGAMKLGFISGTSINHSSVFEGWETIEVETEYGSVSMKQRGEVYAQNRHGFFEAKPPHAINYRANVDALCQLGVERVVTLSSVGSLDAKLKPGTLVSLEDYMSFQPKTFIDDRMSAFAPVLQNADLEGIAAVSSLPIERGKIYMQTPGPRFETRAEVRALRQWGADVVGMTFANEADLLLEREIGVTPFCMVDNFAHGVSESELSMEAFQRLVRENQAKIDTFLRELVDYLGSRA